MKQESGMAPPRETRERGMQTAEPEMWGDRREERPCREEGGVVDREATPQSDIKREATQNTAKAGPA